MKRILAVIMTLCVLMSLCACGATDPKNTVHTDTNAEENTYEKVTFADGATETFELGEFSAKKQENPYAHFNKYNGNKIEVVTTITSIESNYLMAGFATIDFDGGWYCYLEEGSPVLFDLKKGSLVKVTGTLIADALDIENPTITIMN